MHARARADDTGAVLCSGDDHNDDDSVIAPGEHNNTGAHLPSLPTVSDYKSKLQPARFGFRTNEEIT